MSSSDYNLSTVTPVPGSSQGIGYAGNPQVTWTGSGIGTGGNQFNNITWTTTSSPTYTLNTQPYVIREDDGKITLDGEGADLVMNGISLKDTLRAIEERLCILRPNPVLEAQWDQLRELGEAYRNLEAKLREKQEMWDTLKKMPPPEIK